MVTVLLRKDTELGLQACWAPLRATTLEPQALLLLTDANL